MKIMKHAFHAREITLEQIAQTQSGRIRRDGLGCAGVLFLIGGIWAAIGVGMLFIGAALTFFGGLFILLLAAGVLYLGLTILKNRKQNMNADVRLSVQECRCVDFKEESDIENTYTYALFQNTAGKRLEVSIFAPDRFDLENREGYLVIDDTHREVLMFFPKDIWQRTPQGFQRRS